MRQAVADGAAYTGAARNVVRSPARPVRPSSASGGRTAATRSTAGSPASRPSTTRRSPSSSSWSRATAPAPPRRSPRKIFDYYFSRTNAGAGRHAVISWRETRPFDYILLARAMALTVYGLLLIYSGCLTSAGGDGESCHRPGRPSGRLRRRRRRRLPLRLAPRLSLPGQGSAGLYFGLIAVLLFVLTVGDADLRLAALDRRRRHARPALGDRQADRHPRAGQVPLRQPGAHQRAARLPHLAGHRGRAGAAGLRRARPRLGRRSSC